MTTFEKLSLFWIFLYLNFIFCDVISLMYPPMIQQMAAGNSIDGIEITQGFMLAMSVVMELGLVMVIASRLLPHGLNRWANILVGLALFAVQAATLVAGSNTLHYWFFSAVELATLGVIVWIAFNWRQAARSASPAAA